MYSVDGLKKQYGGRLVLDIDRLEIKSDELFAIVGPSGAGKSTFLRLLHFLEEPSQGQIRYRNNLVKYPVSLSLRRTVGMVFQRPEMLKGTVKQNVEIGLRFRGLLDSKKVSRAIERVGLDHLKDAQVENLSGGELQRVALARVLVLHPAVLLLDEPTANLDPRNVTIIEQIVRELREISGTTIVLVTHNIFQARRLGDRVALMMGGRVIETNTVQEFFQNPQDDRVRAFVAGEMVY